MLRRRCSWLGCRRKVQGMQGSQALGKLQGSHRAITAPPGPAPASPALILGFVCCIAPPRPPPPSRRSRISPQASAQQFALRCLFPELSALRTPQYFAFGHGAWMPSWCLARNSGRVTHNLRPSPTPEMSCLRDQ